MTPLDPAEIISMWTDETGQPQRFIWRGQRHTILCITNHWRVDMLWWRTQQERDSYLVVTDTGWLAVIYRDVPTDTWYMDRCYE